MSSQAAVADLLLGSHRGKAKAGQNKINTAPQNQQQPKPHSLRQSKIPGGGEVVEIDMMQYCNAEMELPLEKHFDIMGHIEEDMDDDDDVELMNLNLVDSDGDSGSNSNKSKENESSNNIRTIDSSDNGKKYRPLPTKKPNRDSSLLENGNLKLDDVIEEKTNKPTYHPALRAAVCAEGQEVMWHEDEYSTVSSVMIKPKPEALDKIVDLSAAKKPPQRHLLPFFHRHKHQEEQVVVEPDPIKIHVKRKKVKKSVVLLPQEDNPNKEEQLELEATASAEQEAIKNMIKARELLNAALVMEETPRLEESEKMARFAFEHAQIARRLAESHSKTINKKNKPRAHAEEQEKDIAQEELEHVLSYLAEQGQEAVYQHQKIVFSQSYGDDEDDEDDDEVENQNGNGVHRAKKSKKRGLGEYAARAVHYLESILPKNVGEQPKEIESKLTKALSAEDYWSDAGISTLGMNNDTFEYGFSCGVPSMPPIVQTATSRFNMDLMSLSSLNEILDGPIEDDQPEDVDNKKGKTSPREVLPVIDVPNRKPSKRSHKPPRPGRILGLVTPSAKKHTLKNLLTPRKNVSTDSSTLATKKAKNSKKWTIFPAKHPEEAVECPPIDEEKEVVESEQENDADFLSDAVLGEVLEEESEVFLEDIERPLSEEQNVVSLREIKSGSTDSHASKGDERYNPPPESVDGMNLSTSATFQGPTLDSTKSMKEQAVEEWDDSVYQRNINELQSISISESGLSSRRGITASKTAYSESPGDDQSDWDESFNLIPSDGSKRREEPVGKTPRRDRHDIEPSLSRVSEDEEIPSNSSRLVTKIDDFDSGLDNDLPRETKKKNDKKKGKGSLRNKKELPKESVKSPASTTDHGRNTVVSNDPLNRAGEISLAGKSEGIHSEGSKTKIFERIVDIMGHKRNPMIPTAVVEETYIVTAKHKKSMTHDGDEQQPKAEPKDAHTHKKSKTVAHHGHRKETKKVHEKNQKVEKDGKNTKRPKNKAKPSSSAKVYGDSTVVIEQAVSNGNLKALQSNEEDEAPENYLALMLKRKAREERQRSQEDGSVDTERTPVDADSFVAAIRGPRHQECPGVALEGIASRNPHRDPTNEDNDRYEIRNLAPTPRRPERIKSLEGIDPSNDHDPPLDDTKERQRMITERLYAAGSSSFDAENPTSRKLLEMTPSSKVGDNNDDHDLLHMVPTVDSAASYEDEQDDIGVEVDLANDDNEGMTDDDHMEKDEGKNKEDRRSKRNMGRMSFLLPGMLKLKM